MFQKRVDYRPLKGTARGFTQEVPQAFARNTQLFNYLDQDIKATDCLWLWIRQTQALVVAGFLLWYVVARPKHQES